MKTRVTPLLPLALMAFLGVLTLWLHYAVLESAGSDPRAPGHDPDSIVENFTVQKLDTSGKLEYTFSAPKMTHFADDGSGEVLYPRVVQIARDGGRSEERRVGKECRWRWWSYEYKRRIDE